MHQCCVCETRTPKATKTEKRMIKRGSADQEKRVWVLALAPCVCGADQEKRVRGLALAACVCSVDQENCVSSPRVV